MFSIKKTPPKQYLMTFVKIITLNKINAITTNAKEFLVG